MLDMNKLFDDVFNSPLDDSPIEAESHSETASQTPSLVDKHLAFSKTHDATSRAGHSVERVAVLLGGGSPSADVAEEMRRSSPNGVEYTEEFAEMLGSLYEDCRSKAVPTVAASKSLLRQQKERQDARQKPGAAKWSYDAQAKSVFQQ